MIERARPLLGTVVAIRIDDAVGAAASHAIEAAFERIALIERLMSYQQVDSELSRLNRSAAYQALKVSDHMFRVLRWAQRLQRESFGRFDAVAPHRRRRGARARQGPMWPQPDLLLLPGQRVRFGRPLRLDLSGIAKGYAVDLAMLALRAHGVRHALINAGGDLRAIGPRVVRIALRTAGRSAHTGVIELADGALATSTGAQGTGGGGLTVSVAARRCLLADALTKVALAEGAPTPTVARILARFGARAWYHEPTRGWQSVNSEFRGERPPGDQSVYAAS